MATPLIRTAPTLKLKVFYKGRDVPEKTVGYAANFQFTVSQGQKPIYTVDTPYAAELAQGAAPQLIQGSLTLYMVKGMDPVRVGLVPPPNSNINNAPVHAFSEMLDWRIYDRFSGELAWAINDVKVSQWSVSTQAKSIVTAQLTFQGIYYSSGTQQFYPNL